MDIAETKSENFTSPAARKLLGVEKDNGQIVDTITLCMAISVHASLVDVADKSYNPSNGFNNEKMSAVAIQMAL